MSKTKILYEDNHILVCHKPAGIATQTSRVGQADMASEMENYLAQRIFIVHRLDQPVEGILVFAKQQTAAAALSAQAAGDGMEKEYLALVCDQRGEAKREQNGTLTDYLLKDGKTNVSRVAAPEVKGAKEARLSFEILSEPFAEALSEGDKAKEAAADQTQDLHQVMLVRIRLYTGRHHQIRVQMANAGMPLLGDRKYAPGETIALSERMGLRDVALCAYRLRFLHPGTGERLSFEIIPQGTAFRGIRF